MGAGHPGGEVGVDQVRPTELRREPISRREIAAHVPFLLADAIPHGRGLDGFQLSCRFAHGALLCYCNGNAMLNLLRQDR